MTCHVFYLAYWNGLNQSFLFKYECLQNGDIFICFWKIYLKLFVAARIEI